MDIHRCRYVPYQPQAINAIAFSHTSTPKQRTPKDLKLAIARDNGDIEIWDPLAGLWVQERVFPGSVGRTVENLQWTQDLILSEQDNADPVKIEDGPVRLFSSGGSTSITEWDLATGLPKQHAEGNSGDIWCFAPQPQWSHAQARSATDEVKVSPSQLLAAGCADGSIVLFTTTDNELRFDRVLQRPHSKKSRCLSITWKDRNTVVAGFEESVLRVIDVRTKQSIRNMSLGKSREGDKPVVWAVKCLPNGTILSGDSTGELKIWDSQNFSLVQRLKSHIADIMDITTNSAGTMILTCGVDRRTVAYAPQANQPNSRTQRWHEIRHRRFHEHDVKTIAAFESKSLSIAVSGGLDTVPVVVPLRNWNDEYHRTLPHLPQKAHISVSTSARLMLTWANRDLYIWHLPEKYREVGDSDSIIDESLPERLLAQIRLKDDEHITSANLSPSGSMIAAATTAGVKWFQLRRTISSAGVSEMRSRALDLPRNMALHGANIVTFSADEKWLCSVRLNNVVVLAKVQLPASPKEKPVVHDRIVKLDRKRRKSQVQSKPQIGNYTTHITTAAFSSDSRILAVGDLGGNVDTWILEGHEASQPQIAPNSYASSDGSSSDSDSDSDDETDSRVIAGQKWIRTPSGSNLPSLESAILTLAFKPSSRATPENPSGITGNEGLHPTRNTRHPVSHEHPPQEAGHLVTVTANHQVVIFDVIACRLSDWSRQNPSSMLPDSFRQIKDRVMGVWLDFRPESHIDRLWLYGTNFLYMLDLAQNLSAIKAATSSKQKGQLVKVGKLGDHVLEAPTSHALVKSADAVSGKKRKRGTGAGDQMKENQSYGAIVSTRDQDDDVEMGLLSPPRSLHASDEEVSDEDMDDVLEPVKTIQADENADTSSRAILKPDAGPSTWHTFQYRSIFGACALADPIGTNATEPPEVVIVERPLYDINLPPRFTAGQEWD